MKKVFGVLVFVGILLSLACAHKKYTEQAAELAAAGNHELASRRALDALDLASDHTPAIVILSSSGPRYVDAELEGARSRAESESFDDALVRLEALGRFVSHAGRYGVKLDAGRVERQAEETREAAARHWYEKAEQLRAERRFADAIEDYLRSEGYVPEYRDSIRNRAECHYQLAMAAEAQSRVDEAIGFHEAALEVVPEYRDSRLRIAELYYQMGTAAISAKRHRRAVELLDRADQWSPGYEDAAELSAELLEEAILRVALMPLENQTGATIPGVSIEGMVYDTALSRLDADGSRFLQVLDRDTIDMVLEEHGLASSGLFDASTLPPGELEGVDYLIIARVTQLISTEEEPVRREKSMGYRVPTYRQVQQRRDDGSIVTKLKRTGTGPALAVFTDVVQRSTVEVGGSIRIIDVRSGRVVESQPFMVEKEDAAHYAENLRHQGPNGSRESDLQKGYPSEVLELANGDRRVSSSTSLAQSAVEDVASEISSMVLGRLDAGLDSEEEPALAGSASRAAVSSR